MTEASRGEHLVEILITIARSEYPDECPNTAIWLRNLRKKQMNERANSPRRIVPGDASPVMIAINMG